MGSLVVVFVVEAFDEGVELLGLACEPVFEGLLEAFDLASGRGVVRAGVLLRDVSLVEFFL